MKASLLALALGLASAPVFAADGEITFVGKVTSGTCSIEVVDPGSEDPRDRIDLAPARAEILATAGDTTSHTPFDLKIKTGGSCTEGATKKATIMFDTVYKNESSQHFSLNTSIPGYAQGVELAIQDGRTGTFVEPAKASAEFDLADNADARLSYTAMYIRNANAITAGPAEATVGMTITTN